VQCAGCQRGDLVRVVEMQGLMLGLQYGIRLGKTGEGSGEGLCGMVRRRMSISGHLLAVCGDFELYSRRCGLLLKDLQGPFSVVLKAEMRLQAERRGVVFWYTR
jgi:hypothetical protein